MHKCRTPAFSPHTKPVSHRKGGGRSGCCIPAGRCPRVCLVRASWEIASGLPGLQTSSEVLPVGSSWCPWLLGLVLGAVSPHWASSHPVTWLHWSSSLHPAKDSPGFQLCAPFIPGLGSVKLNSGFLFPSLWCCTLWVCFEPNAFSVVPEHTRGSLASLPISVRARAAALTHQRAKARKGPVSWALSPIPVCHLLPWAAITGKVASLLPPLAVSVGPGESGQQQNLWAA